MSLEPSNAKAHSRRGAAYLGMGRVEEAAEAYSRSLQVRGSNPKCALALDSEARHKRGRSGVLERERPCSWQWGPPSLGCG